MTEGISGRPGFCLRREIVRADAALIARLARFPVALIGDGFGRRAIMAAAIKPLDPETRLAGPAITVEVRAADNLMIHAAIALAHPGDVLVIDAHGDVSSAVFGGILAEAVKAKGIAGVIVDGAVRDGAEIRGLGLPVFARAVTPVGPDRDGPGQVNLPIACGGVPVGPGDAVLGDADGVIVVPAALMEAAIAGAEARERAEARIHADIAAGKTTQDFLIPALRAKGVLGPDETL